MKACGGHGDLNSCSLKRPVVIVTVNERRFTLSPINCMDERFTVLHSGIL